MYRYAELNEKNIVIGDSFLKNKMLEIPHNLDEILGKKYNEEKNIFENIKEDENE